MAILGAGKKYEIDPGMVREYLDQGLTIKEISVRLGVSYQLAYDYVRKKKYDPEYAKAVLEKQEQKKRMNRRTSNQRRAKRKKKCSSCQFRGEVNKNGCDYILIMGHRRGCSVEECDKYKKGKRIKISAARPIV